MNNSLVMHAVKGLDYRHEHLNSFLDRDSLFPLETLRKRFALKILHGNIGCAVFAEAIKNFNNSVFVAEFRQSFCLIDKFLHAIVKLLSLVARKHRNLSLPNRSC